MNVMANKINKITYSGIVITQNGFLIFMKALESVIPDIRSSMIVIAVVNEKNRKKRTTIFII